MLMNRFIWLLAWIVFQSSVSFEPETTYAQDMPKQDASLINQKKSGQDSRLGWQTARDQLMDSIRRSDQRERMRTAINRIMKTTTKREFEAALEPLTLLRVSINPESRVKLNAVRSKIRLVKDRPHVFVVVVENTAGITAPLNLSAVDVATDPPGVADWCKIEVVETPFVSRFFSGRVSEYKIMQITPHVSGLREIRIVGDAGQGTQDLGFRATADVLMDINAMRKR